MFINKLMKTLKPNWLRPDGSNVVRLQPCGNRRAVMERTPTELRNCMSAGANTTLMVWADCDDDCTDGDSLKDAFWTIAQQDGIRRVDFDQIVFAFAKDRLENWIEFLSKGRTDEKIEGPRLKHNREAADAAKKLAQCCAAGGPIKDMPPSLQWSCRNWQALRARME